MTSSGSLPHFPGPAAQNAIEDQSPGVLSEGEVAGTMCGHSSQLFLQPHTCYHH